MLWTNHIQYANFFKMMICYLEPFGCKISALGELHKHHTLAMNKSVVVMVTLC